MWGWTFDFSDLANGVVHAGPSFLCGADTANQTQWNITFRAAGADPQIPGDLLATRTVSYSSLVLSTAGINFDADGVPPPGPSVQCTSAGAMTPTCVPTAEWTFDFPPVPSENVRWIGVQQQQGVNAPDGHPCVQTLLLEADTATYDDEVYHRGGAAENVNQDLQICVGTTNLKTLDIDGDGETTPLIDGVLGLRSLFGFTGNTLITAAYDDQNCTRCTINQIRNYTEELTELDIIDIDGNGDSATADRRGALPALSVRVQGKHPDRGSGGPRRAAGHCARDRGLHRGTDLARRAVQRFLREQRRVAMVGIAARCAQLPSASRLMNSRNAPGTPAGSWRKNASPV